MKVVLVKIFFVVYAIPAIIFAQTDGSLEEAKAIEDNSFFVEEAFNQEDGVVQHISNIVYTRQPDDALSYSLTQEWPLFSYLHQLSFTVPLNLVSKSDKGIGNIMMNWILVQSRSSEKSSVTSLALRALGTTARPSRPTLTGHARL